MKSLVRMSFTTMSRLLFGIAVVVATPIYFVFLLAIIVAFAIIDGLSYLHDWSHGRTDGRDTFVREFWAERLADVVEEVKLIAAIVAR